MNLKRFFLIQCLTALSAFTCALLSAPIQSGSWSSPSGDVKFYISQPSQLDTLSVQLTFSGNCSGSMTTYAYGVGITNGSFSRNLGSTFEGSTGSITGTFSADGKSCSGIYTYKKSPCDDISVNWTATVGDSVPGDDVNITDPNFLSALIEQGVDTDENGRISYAEAGAVTSLDVQERSISDMTGIEAFVNLLTLNCIKNQLLTIDLSMNVMLNSLRCYSNELIELDVSKNSELSELLCFGNQLTTLDISKNSQLSELWCSLNQLSGLNVSLNPNLTYLDCGWNQIGELDVSNNILLEELDCSRNNITNLNISKSTLLTDLTCHNNLLTSLDVSKNPDLEDLYCNNNELGSLDVSGNKYLFSLFCRNTGLSELSVEQNLLLMDLRCSGNKLTVLDLSKNHYLEYLDCGTNLLPNLDVTTNTELTNLICDENLLINLDISNNTAIGTTDYTWSDELDISGMPTLTCVSVWELPFPPSSLEVVMDGSPNVVFTTEPCSGVGIVEDIQSELVVYPNPVKAKMSLQLTVPAEYSIEIVSLNGQKIIHQEFSGSSYDLDLSSFRKGLYFITIRSIDFTATRKIIKL